MRHHLETTAFVSVGAIFQGRLVLYSRMAPPAVRRSLRPRRSQARHPRAFQMAASTSPVCSEEEVSDSDFAPSSHGSSPVDSEVEESLTIKPQRKRRKLVRKFVDPVSQPTTLKPYGQSRCSLEPKHIPVLRAALLDWYTDNFRVLPWRAPPLYRKGGLSALPRSVPRTPSSAGSPYAVWVSEVMSQQTRLSVVEGYFKRWMCELPDVHALANTPLEKINQLWAGLGYYRRARFLREGAIQVVTEHDGKLPEDVPSLLQIKGIGRYTAGAISSIAFGKNVPLVDGNVERVFARLCPGLTSSKAYGEKPVALPAAYWELAETLVKEVDCPGDFNQALMEFGATLCKPKAVMCDVCPIQNMCGAYQEAVTLGNQDPAEYVTRYPIKDPKKATKVRSETVFVLVACVHTGPRYKYLVLQRPSDGLLGGLWEAPNMVMPSKNEKEADCAWTDMETVVKETLDHLDKIECKSISSKSGKQLQVEVGNVIHIFSHIRQTLNIRLTVMRNRDGNMPPKNGKTSKGVSFRWICEDELKKGAVSTQMKKVFAAALKKLPRAEKIR